MTDHERERNLKLATVWRKTITSAAHYSITQTAAYEAGVKSAQRDKVQAV